MLKVLLTLITHRALLFSVGWGALYFSNASEKKIPSFLTNDLLSQAALFLSSYIDLSPDFVLLILSNFLLLLFLWQLNSFCNQLSLPDTAINTCILAVLWVTSYELSLGSPVVLECLLVTSILNFSNHGFWLITSVLLGLLSTHSFIGIFILPFLMFSLWSQNRYAPSTTLARKAIYLAIALGVAFFLKWDFWTAFPANLSNSLLLNVSSLFKVESIAPSFSFVFFGLSSLFSLFVFSSLLHRFLVLLLFLGLGFTSSPNSFGSQVLIIAPVLIGLADLFPGSILKMVQLVLLVLGSIEVFNLMG